MTVEVTVGEPVITSRVPDKGLFAEWWGTLEAKTEDWTDQLLYGYSQSVVSDVADDTVAGAKVATDTALDSVKKAKLAADKWGGFISDPEKLEGVLNKVMIVVVILGIVYVIATVAPLIPRGAK